MGGYSLGGKSRATDFGSCRALIAGGLQSGALQSRVTHFGSCRALIAGWLQPGGLQSRATDFGSCHALIAGGLQSGGLQSRATDFGSCRALIAGGLQSGRLANSVFPRLAILQSGNQLFLWSSQFQKWSRCSGIQVCGTNLYWNMLFPIVPPPWDRERSTRT